MSCHNGVVLMVRYCSRRLPKPWKDAIKCGEETLSSTWASNMFGGVCPRITLIQLHIYFRNYSLGRIFRVCSSVSKSLLPVEIPMLPYKPIMFAIITPWISSGGPRGLISYSLISLPSSILTRLHSFRLRR
jgi:hypothetical protein